MIRKDELFNKVKSYRNLKLFKLFDLKILLIEEDMLSRRSVQASYTHTSRSRKRNKKTIITHEEFGVLGIELGICSYSFEYKRLVLSQGDRKQGIFWTWFGVHVVLSVSDIPVFFLVSSWRFLPGSRFLLSVSILPSSF
jgi:hypothetical protein